MYNVYHSLHLLVMYAVCTYLTERWGRMVFKDMQAKPCHYILGRSCFYSFVYEVMENVCNLCSTTKKRVL